MSVRRVVMYSLGGTIAMTKRPDGTVEPALSGDELAAAVPGLSELDDVTLEVRDFRRLPGASLSFRDLGELAADIAGRDADGFVVTQGTDTIEETAYFLDLVLGDDRPVVVTGAMRNASQAGPDGPANVLASVRVAAAARGVGSVVVFGEEIHAASFVAKTHTSSPLAFASYPGPIGFVAEERVELWSRPQRRAALKLNLDVDARTAVATIGLGDDGTVLRAIGEVVDGLVVAALGVGHVPELCVEALTDLAKAKPVVLTSRTGRGPLLRHTYGFAGSESDLLARGLATAGSLSPVKARILLQCLLMAGVPAADIAVEFAATEPTIRGAR